MRKARGLFITAAVVMLAAGLSSCGAYRRVVPTDARLTDSSTHAKRSNVAGYTTTDGRYHPFVAYVAVRGDSVILTRPATPPVMWSSRGGSPESVIVLPRDEVGSLKLPHGVSVLRTVGLVLGIVTFLVAAAMIDYAQ